MTPAELRKYISPKEAAELLGVSPGAIRDWATKRLVRSARIGPWGTNVRVHTDDLMLMVSLRSKNQP